MIFDAGSPVLIEVEYKKQTPYSTLDYFDPTPTPKIEVTDPDGVVKVAATDLTKSAVGKWFYVCQTATDWVLGDYSAKATGGDGANTDVTINLTAFNLR